MGILDSIMKTVIANTIIETAGNVTEKVLEVSVQHETNRIAKQEIKSSKSNSSSEILMLKIPSSSDDYIGKNYMDVVGELNAYGYKNIVLMPKKDLFNGWLVKDGEIEEITINGKEHFRKNAKFPSESRIVIVYHTFRDK